MTIQEGIVQPVLYNVTQDDWPKFKVDLPVGQHGKWLLRKFTIEPNDEQRLRLAFTQQRDPGVGTFTGLYEDGDKNPWMSDTAAEIFDHYEVIDIMGFPNVERVLIHGLGIGMVLKAALSYKHVQRVDVVEIDEDLIKLVGPHYLKDPRVRIHLGDAYTFRFPKGTRWDVAWHDIWPTIASTNLEGMQTLHSRYGGRTKWQGSWAREKCKQLAKFEQMDDETIVQQALKGLRRNVGDERFDMLIAEVGEQTVTFLAVQHWLLARGLGGLGVV